MTVYIVAVAAVAAGLAIGVGLMVAARRTATSRDQAVRRQRIVQECVIAVIAALLIFDAFDTPHHRWFNVVVVALLAGGVGFDWLQRRRNTSQRA